MCENLSQGVCKPVPGSVGASVSGSISVCASVCGSVRVCLLGCVECVECVCLWEGVGMCVCVCACVNLPLGMEVRVVSWVRFWKRRFCAHASEK